MLTSVVLQITVGAVVRWNLDSVKTPKAKSRRTVPVLDLPDIHVLGRNSDHAAAYTITAEARPTTAGTKSVYLVLVIAGDLQGPQPRAKSHIILHHQH
jgi:hypothetical protein